jgi:hypothetical protein
VSELGKKLNQLGKAALASSSEMQAAMDKACGNAAKDL